MMLSLTVASSQVDTTVQETLATQLIKVSENWPLENIYFQTNKGIFETGEDLWFKGYVLNSMDLGPSQLSRTLYVQLVEERDSVPVWQEKYRIENGFVDGHIHVSDTLRNGNYLLQAFTQYSFLDNQSEVRAVRRLHIVERISKGVRDSLVAKAPVLAENDSIHFGLYPESGHLVSGVQSVVAFKAIDKSGRPIKVSGTLYEDGKRLLDIRSVHAGMGSFVLAPNSNSKYHITLDAPHAKDQYQLPTIQPEGHALRLVGNTREHIRFLVSKRTHTKEKVYVRVQSRGVVHHMAEVEVEQERFVKFPLDKVPRGIVEVTLFNTKLMPVAERLVYVKHGQKLYIEATLDKESYMTKERAKLKIKVTDQNQEPVVAHLGLSVHDALYGNPSDSKTIESHYHLSTQLRGRLHDPAHYFDGNNKNRKQALDLLLLTQGWRSYVWNGATLRAIPKKMPLLTDGTEGQLAHIKKRKDAAPQNMVMVYDPLKEDEKSLVPLDGAGRFVLGPTELNIGRRLFVKHFGKENERIRITFKRPFNTISKIIKNKSFSYPSQPILEEEEVLESNMPTWSSIREGVELEEVVVTQKRKRVVRNKYMGKLDSLAKIKLSRW